MKSTFLFIALFALSALGAVLIDNTPSHDGQYIVVLHDHATEDHRAEVISKINARRKRSEGDDLTHHTLEDFKAFSGALDSESIQELLKEEMVSYIQPNYVYHTNGQCVRSKAVWHLERLNTKNRPPRFTGVYSNSEDGANVDAYIMDSGIEIDHPEFEGRATWGINTADRYDEDCDGHGTHVAGTVGSRSYGVAKKVNLIAVKTMNCQGRGTSITLLKGHEFVGREYQSKGKRPSVVNMSLGSPYDRAHNDIVSRAIRTGLVYVIAAGNENQDACDTSPASVSSAITVGATNGYDEITDFSNYGTCVHILAPGQEITSTWINRGINTIDGTSMASPHVAGAAALYLSRFPKATPEEVKRGLLKESSSDIIKNNWKLRGTPNNLLFSGCNGPAPTKVVTATKVVKTFTRTKSEVVEVTGQVTAIGNKK